MFHSFYWEAAPNSGKVSEGLPLRMGRTAKWYRNITHRTENSQLVYMPNFALVGDSLLKAIGISELCRGRLRQLELLQQADSRRITPEIKEMVPFSALNWFDHLLGPWSSASVRARHGELAASGAASRLQLRRQLQSALASLLTTGQANTALTKQQGNASVTPCTIADAALFAYVHSVAGCNPATNQVSALLESGARWLRMHDAMFAEDFDRQQSNLGALSTSFRLADPVACTVSCLRA